MSKKNPAKVTGPPGRPILPPQAETEILVSANDKMKENAEEKM